MKRVLVIVLAALAVAVLTGLGVWQLDRRALKHDRIAAIDAGLAAAPATLSRPPELSDAWRRVRLEGAWPGGAPVRIAPTTFAGKVGADYAAPFLLLGGAPIVVRLGWAPEGAAPPPAPEGEAVLEGVLAPPPRTNLFTPDNRPPDTWHWLEPGAIVDAAGLPAERTTPLTLQLTSPPAGLKARPARPDIPDDHLQYALTWFALAAALAVVATLFVRGQRKSQP